MASALIMNLKYIYTNTFVFVISYSLFEAIISEDLDENDAIFPITDVCWFIISR